jgi:hypothetical protein
MRSGLSERTTSPFEVWAAPSPCGLGSRSIARAEEPTRPSPATRVSGLTADDRCRGSLRLAVAHHCGRRGCGWSSRLPAREHNGSRRSHRTDHSCGSAHRSHWRPSKLAHASEQSSLNWDRTGLAMRFQSIFTSTELRRVVQAASASDRDRFKGASRTDHPVDHVAGQ